MATASASWRCWRLPKAIRPCTLNVPSAPSPRRTEGHADFVRIDAANAPTNWQHAEQYAQEALDLAPQARNHPDYGTAFFNANMVLGMAAMRNGDAKSAAAYLLKAADAPATDALRYPIGNARPWPTIWHFPDTLAAALLQAGERDAVVAFLEKYARITVSGRGRTLLDIALIRSGKLPDGHRPEAAELIPLPRSDASSHNGG